MDILYNIKREFQKGNMVNKLIYINISIFLLSSILSVVSFMFQINIDYIIEYLYLPADNNKLLNQPWTFISYMFLHNSFFHLLFNMIWLHFGGKIFLQYLSAKQLLNIYILGGISGGILFILSYNYIPALELDITYARALGASASVLAIMVAISTYKPEYTVHLPFFGSIKLKHIAITCVLLDILNIPNGNSGGHIAHIGGAIFGYIYIKQSKKQENESPKTNTLINKFISIFKKKGRLRRTHQRRAKSDYQFNMEKSNEQERIDNILEKIAKSGYDSLSKEEKKKLFSASKK